MYCHNCGQRSEDTGARFCAKCGTQLRAAETASTQPPPLSVVPPPAPACPPPAPASAPAGAGVGERLLKEGNANHFKGIEAVGGRLELTDRHLVFNSHAFNFQTHRESYPLEAIVSVKPRNTLGLVPNGMAIGLCDGREERFVVFGRGEWMSAIIEAKARIPRT